MALKQDTKSQVKRGVTVITALGLSTVIGASLFGKNDNSKVRYEIGHDYAAEVSQEYKKRTADKQNYYYDVDGMATTLLKELNQPDLLGVKTNLNKEEKALIYLGILLENDEIEDMVIWQVYQKIFGLDNLSLEQAKNKLCYAFLGGNYDPNNNQNAEELLVELCNSILNHELTPEERKAVYDEKTRREAELDLTDHDNEIDISNVNIEDAKNYINSEFGKEAIKQEMLDVELNGEKIGEVPVNSNTK